MSPFTTVSIAGHWAWLEGGEVVWRGEWKTATAVWSGGSTASSKPLRAHEHTPQALPEILMGIGFLPGPSVVPKPLSWHELGLYWLLSYLFVEGP